MPTPRSGARGGGCGGRADPGGPAVPGLLGPAGVRVSRLSGRGVFQSAPQEVKHCWRWSVFVASPRTWDPELCKLALSLAALQEVAKTNKLAKLENKSITGTSLWAPSCAELPRWWRRMRRAYPTGWVGETCRSSQVVICPDFHLIDWLQSQWGLCVPLFRKGLLLGAGRRREHPSPHQSHGSAGAPGITVL